MRAYGLGSRLPEQVPQHLRYQFSQVFGDQPRPETRASLRMDPHTSASRFEGGHTLGHKTGDETAKRIA